LQERRRPRDPALEDAPRLVRLYAEKESPKVERAAMKRLRRCLEEREPTLKEFAKVVRSLEQRVLDLGEPEFAIR
jgi:hypothetical protein